MNASGGKTGPDPMRLDTKLPYNASSTSQIIATLPFFAGLKVDEKAELTRVANVKQVPQGEQIFWAGDPLTYIYWIVSGAVQKYRETPDGHELTSAIRIAGEMLYAPDPLQAPPLHAMNAKALEDCVLLLVPAAWVREHIKSWDHLADKFLTFMAQRVQEARLDAEHQSVFTSAQIIACFLQHLCAQYGYDPKNFTLPYTKSLIASRLGMELESFSRALPKLRKIGIDVRGRHVSFTDKAAAQAFSCGSCSVAEDCNTHKALSKR